MSEVKLLTQAEYAKHRKCSAVSVFKAVKANRISLIDGKIDPAVADIQWARNTRARVGTSGGTSADTVDGTPLAASSVAELAINAPTATQPATNPEQDGYLVYRARREAAEAKIAEMKEAEMRGKILVKADVDAAIFEIARSLRDGLTNCSRRIASEVAGSSDAGECEEIIDREHRALMANLTHQLAHRMGIAQGEPG